jgi:hypothetical protein
MSWLPWVRRKGRVLRTWLRNMITHAFDKPPIKYLALTYRILRTHGPFDEWDSRKVKYRAYCAWAIAFSIGANALSPAYSSKANWLDGFDGLSMEQRLQFADAFNARPEIGALVSSVRERHQEDRWRGTTPAGLKIRAKLGNIDPARIAAHLSETNPELGRAFLNAIEPGGTE